MVHTVCLGAVSTYKLQENLVFDDQHSLYQVIPLKIIVWRSGRPFLMRKT
jgi:hypothetical protein